MTLLSRQTDRCDCVPVFRDFNLMDARSMGESRQSVIMPRGQHLHLRRIATHWRAKSGHVAEYHQKPFRPVSGIF